MAPGGVTRQRAGLPQHAVRTAVSRLVLVLALLAACDRSQLDGAIPDSPDAAQPLAVGSPAPAVSFRGLDGKTVPLASLLADGPVALVFYRGGW